MTTTLRSLYGLAFAALLALSLVATTQDALAKTSAPTALPALFDSDFLPGFVDRDFDFVEKAKKHLPRPHGRLGVSWE